ncbi:hypothetical protein OAK75_00030 [Bacteriovoracales bacterium]|nr:hypothetical protein [Bacteriovoracales bacterium]
MNQSKDKKEEEIEFPVVIIKKNGNFLCRIVELGIIEKNVNLNTAYEKAILKKDEIIEQFREEDELESVLNLKNNSNLRTAVPNDNNTSFFVKYGVLAVFCFVIGALGLNYIKNSLRNTLKNQKIGMKIERTIEKVAQKNIADERIAKTQGNIKIIVKKYKPLVQEMRELFRD